MTMSNRYGPPLSSEDAMEELRRSAGKQFDGELVEKFILLLERDGSIAVGADESWEGELGFSQRVRRMAQPVPGRPPARK
jgi:HD-GYP domain-containing protein (c-di-GMP phosphodiesterase class II)